MLILNSIQDVRQKVSEFKKQGLKIGLVPTMGALHCGHESLIKKAKQNCDVTIVSVFVNPTQFGPNEDYDKYPRTLEKDAAVCQRNSVDVIFAPTPREMYANDKKSSTLVVPPDCLRNKLCGKSRPEHFDGVDTVVLKLFNITQADEAFFGLKDAQQCVIIKRMCEDLNVPIKLTFCDIVREEDGIALSSRNTYLSEAGRKKALSISIAIKKVKQAYDEGITDIEEIKKTVIPGLDENVDVEYFEFVSFDDLSQREKACSNTLVAIAARVDGVRLIDNVIL